jgi:protoporphyrinogen oxidase
MASLDSVGMSIDLEQHVIQLELKGVVVMSSKIRDCSISGFFRKIDGNVYFETFGTPLTIKEFKSSIAKNKFKVVEAPKDTIEAQKAADAAALKEKEAKKNETVYWTVKLDRGIDSIAEAQKKYEFGKGFEFERDLKNITNSFQHILKFSKPTYTPEILISIPENEAKAILMALPKTNALITIKI